MLGSKPSSSRHFETPHAGTPKYSDSNYYDFCTTLSERCFNHYDGSFHSSRSSTKHNSPTIYMGTLGVCYLRLRFAMHEKNQLLLQLSQEKIRRDIQSKRKNYIQRFFRDAFRSVEEVCKQGSSHDSICTLLEGGKIPALAIKSVILRNGGKILESQICSKEVLKLLSKITSSLLESECEVLYGRSGALQVILFLRRYIEEPKYGRALALQLIEQIIIEGETSSKKRKSDFPLLWAWYKEVYLGAAHGIVGIVFTLLNFHSELEELANSMKKDILGLIRVTINKLKDLLLDANLPSCIGDDSELVHWCHGSPGYILLLVKSYEIFDDPKYLDQAAHIAKTVVCPRGLLRKGVGLCHGISGNAYVFLALHRAEKKRSVNSAYDNEWLNMARHFTDFAIYKFIDLEHVPDNPYSLYEGAAGLCVLLLDMLSPDQAKFPCYEY